MPKPISQILTEIATELPDNITRLISPLDSRTRLIDLADWDTFHLENTWKKSARVRGTANISVATAPATVDGVTLSAGNRVLLTAQTTTSENGLWSFASAGSALTRPLDFATGASASSVTVFVDEGTSANKSYVQTAEGVVGTVGQVWTGTDTATDTNVREKIAELAPTALNGTGASISSFDSANNTSNLIDGIDGNFMSFVSAAGVQSFVRVLLGAPSAIGVLSSIELTNALHQSPSFPNGDLFLDLCDASGNCINSYFFGDRLTAVATNLRITLGDYNTPIVSIRLRQSIPSGNHSALRVGEIKLVQSAVSGSGTVIVLQQFAPSTGTSTGNYFYLDVPWTPPGGTTYRDRDNILTGGTSSTATAAAAFTSVVNAAARKAQINLNNGHITRETATGSFYTLINSAAITLDASWILTAPRGDKLIDGAYVASPTIPAAHLGDWLRVGTRGVVFSGITWYEGQWYQAIQETPGSVDGTSNSHWVLEKVDQEFRDLGNYNPTTNSPALTNATGREQERYIVTAPATQQLRDFGSGNITFPAGQTGELIHKAGVWVFRAFGGGSQAQIQWQDEGIATGAVGPTTINVVGTAAVASQVGAVVTLTFPANAAQDVYSQAHGLVVGNIDSQIGWAADGKPKVVNNTNISTLQSVAILRSIPDVDHITVSSAYEVTSIFTSSGPADPLNYAPTGATNDRLWAWDPVLLKYKHADVGENEVVYYIGPSETVGASLVLALDQARGGAGGTGGGGSGETNTASNVNTTGQGVFKQKTGVNLEFRGIAAAVGDRTSISLDAGTNTIRTDVVEANLLVQNMSGTLPLNRGGTGQTSALTAFNALSPSTTQGDLIYHDGTNDVRLPKGTADQFLRMNAGATAPEWDTITIPTGVAFGLITISAGQATSQSFALPTTPSSLNAVVILRANFPACVSTVHFQHNGAGTINWLTPGGDPPLTAGEFIQYIYPT